MEKTPYQAALAKAIAEFKTLAAFSAAIGVRYQVVQQWLRNERVPAEYCPQIERMSGGRVLCEQLNDRVDWAYLRNSMPPSTSSFPTDKAGLAEPRAG